MSLHRHAMTNILILEQSVSQPRTANHWIYRSYRPCQRDRLERFKIFLLSASMTLKSSNLNTIFRQNCYWWKTRFASKCRCRSNGPNDHPTLPLKLTRMSSNERQSTTRPLPLNILIGLRHPDFGQQLLDLSPSDRRRLGTSNQSRDRRRGVDRFRRDADSLRNGAA